MILSHGLKLVQILFLYLSNGKSLVFIYRLSLALVTLALRVVLIFSLRESLGQAEVLIRQACFPRPLIEPCLSLRLLRVMSQGLTYKLEELLVNEQIGRLLIDPPNHARLLFLTSL